MKNCTTLFSLNLILLLSFHQASAQGTTIKYHEAKEGFSSLDSAGRMSFIRKNPGYRFVLREAYFPDHAVPGHIFAFNISMENTGYISLRQNRPVYLIFRNLETGKEYPVRCKADVRKWTLGAFNWRELLQLPASMTPGKYSLYANFPDKYPSLAKNPEYSIQLGNEACWEESTGYNKLNYILSIGR